MILVIMNIDNTDKIEVKIALRIFYKCSFFVSCKFEKYIVLYMDFCNVFFEKVNFF